MSPGLRTHGRASLVRLEFLPDSLSAPPGRVLKQVLGAWSIHRPLGVYSGQSLERCWAPRVLKQVLGADRARGAVSVFSASAIFYKKTKIQ